MTIKFTWSAWLLAAAAALLGLLVGWGLAASGSFGSAGGSADHAGPGAPAAAAATVWTCSMHPQFRQDHEGSCPICGMDLVLAGAIDAAQTAVTLSESAQRVASIEIATVERLPLEHELSTVGRIELAEPLIAFLTARTRARVERVWADFTGTAVAKGDHLVDLYSPELVVAQQELLSAPTTAMAALARRKLAAWGVTETQLAEIEAEGRPRPVVTLHAPIGGIVIEKNVREGMYVDEGDTLYTIADLSTVWLKAEIYEFELPWVAIGQAAAVAVEGLPGRRFAGTVAFVDPLVNESTRTVRVRVNLPNPDLALRPGMFADATLRSRLGSDGSTAVSPLAGRWVCPMHLEIHAEAPGACSICGMDLREVAGAAGATAASDGLVLAVAATAVLDTGLRRVVYVEEQPGIYAAREVVLGPRAGELYAVLAGLAEGERVVVHGAFLVDSQAQIEGRPSLLSPRGSLGADASSNASSNASAIEGTHAGHGGR